MKKIHGLKKRWYMFRDFIGLPSKKYNYENNYIKIKQMKFYGQFDYKVDKFIYNRYFANRNIKGTCIECGALDGLTDSSCKFFEETLGWDVYNIEAAPPNFEKLIINRPKSKNFNLALSDKSGIMQFNLPMKKDSTGNHICGGNGSLEKYTNEQLNAINKDGYKIINYSVETISYKNFIKQNDICYVDLFVLDVEGHEPEVIQGMKDARVLPDIVVVEINDSKNFKLIRKLMLDLGYHYDITSYVNYYFIKKDILPLYNFRLINNIK